MKISKLISILKEIDREINRLTAENAKLKLIIKHFLYSDWHDDANVQDFIEIFTEALKVETDGN